MQKLGLNELRERFLSFFESKGHLRLPSFRLVPERDASLLLINSGMAPLKPYFTGQEKPPSNRITTCQKCIRTPDIENVGKTARHGTFFEMLGNFSFGDYFKKEAISWAWEFVTEDLKLPLDRLWVSIYLEDDEAFDIWHNYIGLPPEKIVRMGKKDNFWEIGTGPCGPCSEIYFDRGADKGCKSPNCVVGCDCDRYVEFWNLVFTQFNRDEEGNYSRLAKPNIDTGMGLERLACIMQGEDNLFEIDTVKNILNYICEIAGVKYKASEKSDVSIRVITDHIRSTVMMVCDGVISSNEGRGYVLRRLLRRAARHGKLLGINRQFLFDVAKRVINESKAAYPELSEKSEYIRKVIKIEEERFDQTIDQGLNILNSFIDEVNALKQNKLPGEMIFKLHDTYGFPFDLTREIAEENGLLVDEEGFLSEMQRQKLKAREAAKNKENAGWDDNIYSKLDKSVKTEFVGYGNIQCDARILYIIKDDNITDNAEEGDSLTVILDKTVFYAESGGQLGDKGIIKGKMGVIEVNDCKKTPDGKFLHIGAVKEGIIEAGEEVFARVDLKTRLATCKNHTVTHLLHRALKNALGDHVNQAGSQVGADRLRFDFTHFSSLTQEELKQVENEVNEKILDAISVNSQEMTVDEAKKTGAMALFGEKYGDIVRVVKVGDYSLELCGGTHLSNTSEAGLVKILGESGVAAGTRRIEALTGEAAITYYNKKEQLLNEIASALKTTPEDSFRKVDSMNRELRDAQKEIGELRNKLVSGSLDDCLENKIDVKGVSVITARFDQLDLDALRNTGDTLKNKLGSGVLVLATTYGGKVSFVVTATKDVVSKGIHAGNIVREVAKVTGGSGGGRPDMAQAGGKDVSRIDEALKFALSVIEGQI